MRSKKGQVLIFATVFLILLLLVSYSIETENDYKRYFDKYSTLENTMYETCQVAYNSNGTFLDSRFSQHVTDVRSYCSLNDITCNLTISKDAGAPTNLSLLDFSYYNYSILYIHGDFNYTGNFSC